MFQNFDQILSVAVCLYWLSRWPHFRRKNLQTLPEFERPESYPLVSMIVAARDEKAALAGTVRSLLAQDWPNLELIVVDDRSTDGSSELLDQLMLQYPSLKVVHNKILPEGWLGKCWAMHLGSAQAQGQWLLFTDGDVILEKHAVTAALAQCQKQGYDHLCLAPKMLGKRYWRKVVMSSLPFLFYLIQNPRAVFNSKKPGQYIGIGAFNLIRRSLYDQFGGHQSLRLEVVDDVFLGMLAKRNGGRSAFYLGHNLASLEWYSSVGAYVKGLEKNTFAGLRFSVFLLVMAILGQSIIFFVPWLGLFMSQGWVRGVWLLSILQAHVLFAVCCLRHGEPAKLGFGLTGAILIQFYTFVRSAWATLRHRGITWRGTFYRLDQLKAAQKGLRGPLRGSAPKPADSARDPG